MGRCKRYGCCSISRHLKTMEQMMGQFMACHELGVTVWLSLPGVTTAVHVYS